MASDSYILYFQDMLLLLILPVRRAIIKKAALYHQTKPLSQIAKERNTEGGITAILLSSNIHISGTLYVHWGMETSPEVNKEPGDLKKNLSKGKDN